MDAQGAIYSQPRGGTGSPTVNPSLGWPGIGATGSSAISTGREQSGVASADGRAPASAAASLEGRRLVPTNACATARLIVADYWSMSILSCVTSMWSSVKCSWSRRSAPTRSLPMRIRCTLVASCRQPLRNPECRAKACGLGPTGRERAQVPRAADRRRVVCLPADRVATKDPCDNPIDECEATVQTKTGTA